MRGRVAGGVGQRGHRVASFSSWSSSVVDGVAGERQEHVVERLSAGLGLELGGRALGDQAPAVEQPDGVGELVGLLEVLRGEEDRHAVGEQLADDLPQVAAAARVEPGGRFVEEDQPRTADQRHGEVEPALHAAGVRRGAPVGGVGQLEPGQQLVDPARRLAGAAGARGRPSAGGSRGRSAARRSRRTARSRRWSGVRRRARVVTSNPATRASPSSASMSVERMRTMVVLPAPLGPSRA